MPREPHGYALTDTSIAYALNQLVRQAAEAYLTSEHRLAIQTADKAEQLLKVNADDATDELNEYRTELSTLRLIKLKALVSSRIGGHRARAAQYDLLIDSPQTTARARLRTYLVGLLGRLGNSIDDRRYLPQQV